MGWVRDLGLQSGTLRHSVTSSGFLTVHLVGGGDYFSLVESGTVRCHQVVSVRGMLGCRNDLVCGRLLVGFSQG